ncbi:MAG: hypothetical protein ACREJX_02110 [Polyangiaceae bacterium]
MPRQLWIRIAAIGLVGAAAACGSASVSADGFGGDNAGTFGGTSDAGGATNFTPNPDDAGAGSGVGLRGNILCGGTKASCVPDGEDSMSSGCGDTGGTIVDAGGSGTGDYDASTISCHVVATPDDGGYDLAPTCTASSGGHNGASCTASSDCASGFECVGHEGQATCRKYCCDTDCNDGTFCDIQYEASDNKVKVPVCEAVRSCQLLGSPSQCNADETCTVVDENGTTSCVATGPATAGESCDTVHCAADLVCLGDLNARKCYALCSTSAADCASGLTCMSSAPLFREPAVGVCQ